MKLKKGVFLGYLRDNKQCYARNLCELLLDGIICSYRQLPLYKNPEYVLGTSSLKSIKRDIFENNNQRKGGKFSEVCQ